MYFFQKRFFEKMIVLVAFSIVIGCTSFAADVAPEKFPVLKERTVLKIPGVFKLSEEAQKDFVMQRMLEDNIIPLKNVFFYNVNGLYMARCDG